MYNLANPIQWQGSLFDFERKGFFFLGKGAALEQNPGRLFFMEVAMLSQDELKTVNDILLELKRIENMIQDLMNENGVKDAGEIYLEQTISDFSLSEREADVLRLIADGRSNNEISEQIHVSISTVKKHIYNIFNKAGVNSRSQLLSMIYMKQS